MSKEKCCGTCKYNKYGWTNLHNPDFYCGKEDADNYGYNTAYTDECDEWEAKE